MHPSNTVVNVLSENSNPVSSARKNAQELLQAIEGVVIPIVCTALADNPDDQQKGKLQKVWTWLDSSFVYVPWSCV